MGISSGSDHTPRFFFVTYTPLTFLSGMVRMKYIVLPSRPMPPTASLAFVLRRSSVVRARGHPVLVLSDAQMSCAACRPPTFNSWNDRAKDRVFAAGVSDGMATCASPVTLEGSGAGVPNSNG